MPKATQTEHQGTRPAAKAADNTPEQNRTGAASYLASAWQRGAIFLRRNTRDTRVVAVHARAWRRFSIDSAVLATIAVALFLGMSALFSDRVAIRPIQVPADLSSRGYHEEVVARRLVDAWLAISLASPTNKERTNLAGDWEQTDVTLPYANLSLQGLVVQAQSAFGVKPNQIGGEITRDEEGLLTLTLRMTGGQTTVDPVVVYGGESVEDLIERGGEAVMRLVDPYVLASWLAGSRPYEAHDLAQECLVREDCPDERAYNLFGRLAMMEGNLDAAAKFYRQAWTTSLELRRPFVHALVNEASVWNGLAEQALAAGDADEAQEHLAAARGALAQAEENDSDLIRIRKTNAYLEALAGLAASTFDNDNSAACRHRINAMSELDASADGNDGRDFSDITDSEAWIALKALDCPD